MSKYAILALALKFLVTVDAVASQAYTWKQVKIGGGGGFVSGIVFNPSQKGLAYARTDIGGAYKLNSDDSWTPLLDFVGDSDWNKWYVDALATDPVDTSRLYLATGAYTNSWDPNNGNILISSDQGKTFTTSPLPFKVGGNMPGRGMGERLAVDPNSNGILFFGARSGNGLYKSTNFGATWSKVTSFTSTGTYIQDSTDTSGYLSDKIGISWVTFDPTSGTRGSPTRRIFVGVASLGISNVFVSNDAGATWTPVAGQTTTYMPHKGVISVTDKILYITYSDKGGPYDGSKGAVYKYNITSSVWTDITPVTGDNLYFGFGGLAVDALKPGILMVAAVNSWWPDGQIYRTTNYGATWSPLWTNEGTYKKYYRYSNDKAPWLGPNEVISTLGTLQIGWMMESLSIDPHDSQHWLYGTGETIYGGHDLLTWDTAHNVSISSLADGVEETAIIGLISPPTGPRLISATGDVMGFTHQSLDTAPRSKFAALSLGGSTASIDFAGKKPNSLVRVGTATTGKQIANSDDSGSTWYLNYGAADGVSGGTVALSAIGDTILWRPDGGKGVLVSQSTNPFSAVASLPVDSAIASSKINNAIFYAASASTFYSSGDRGKTFTARGSLGASTIVVKIVVNPLVEGDVWVSTDKGLFHSTNSGVSFTAISSVGRAWAIALGGPKVASGPLSIFAVANIGGTQGVFRSDDVGVNWVQINDAGHGFGAAGGVVITADSTIYGRVYIGTNGRGIFYGDASGTAPPPTSTAPTSTIGSTSSASSTSASSSTSLTSTVPSGTAIIVPAYGQCGGSSWTGGTVCVSGYTCTLNNPFYSQCVPS